MRFIEKLKKSKIPSMIYYRIPLHLQKSFRDLNYEQGDFSISEKISEKIFSIPMHPYLSDDDLKTVTDRIGDFS